MKDWVARPHLVIAAAVAGTALAMLATLKLASEIL
ncbi:hypothetical protein FHR20_002079 [Sphingomonas leidyi]|uniref:Uncharacterized protein n=1 Tax=Sphingomonas leidyi TaxID=68569 RepID=A0A7X5V0R1_9SPHN|nr:hypothetical protein [Sphingomonas leidyi]